MRSYEVRVTPSAMAQVGDAVLYGAPSDARLRRAFQSGMGSEL